MRHQLLNLGRGFKLLDNLSFMRNVNHIILNFDSSLKPQTNWLNNFIQQKTPSDLVSFVHVNKLLLKTQKNPSKVLRDELDFDVVKPQYSSKIKIFKTLHNIKYSHVLHLNIDYNLFLYQKLAKS